MPNNFPPKWGFIPVLLIVGIISLWHCDRPTQYVDYVPILADHNNNGRASSLILARPDFSTFRIFYEFSAPTKLSQASINQTGTRVVFLAEHPLFETERYLFSFIPFQYEDFNETQTFDAVFETQTSEFPCGNVDQVLQNVRGDCGTPYLLGFNSQDRLLLEVQPTRPEPTFPYTGTFLYEVSWRSEQTVFPDFYLLRSDLKEFPNVAIVLGRGPGYILSGAKAHLAYATLDLTLEEGPKSYLTVTSGDRSYDPFYVQEYDWSDDEEIEVLLPVGWFGDEKHVMVEKWVLPITQTGVYNSLARFDGYFAVNIESPFSELIPISTNTSELSPQDPADFPVRFLASGLTDPVLGFRVVQNNGITSTQIIEFRLDSAAQIQLTSLNPQLPVTQMYDGCRFQGNFDQGGFLLGTFAPDGLCNEG